MMVLGYSGDSSVLLVSGQSLLYEKYGNLDIILSSVSSLHVG